MKDRRLYLESVVVSKLKKKNVIKTASEERLNNYKFLSDRVAQHFKKAEESGGWGVGVHKFTPKANPNVYEVFK